MNKLNFASLNDAFILGSQQIKDTQEEISKLKSMVLETAGFGGTQSKNNEPKPVEKGYTRVGQPDTTQATFSNPNPGDDVDTLIDKLIQSPRFSDIVSQYISNKYPALSLSSTVYQPTSGPPGQQPTVYQQPPEPPGQYPTVYQQPPGPPGQQPTVYQQPPEPPGQPPIVPQQSKETFGAGAMCDNTKNMIIFILLAAMVYIFFSLFFDN
jgi:hypothetical protein